MKNPADLSFNPPGPGLWQVDGLHTPKPMTALNEATYIQIPNGMKVCMSRYGSLSSGIELAVLHRFAYASLNMLVYRPPGDDQLAKARFQEQAAANPELQERFQRAEYAITQKRWREERIHWDTIGKPWMMGRTLALTDEDPTNMDSETLALHISECLHHMGNSMHFHHILNLCAGLPRSLLFYYVCQWTDLDPHQLEPLMIGSSPISAGDEPELRRLVDAIEADPMVSADISGKGEPAEILASLKKQSGELGDAYRDFIRVVGYRTLDGWEPMNPYALEEPGLIMDKIRHGMTRDYAHLDPAFFAQIKRQIPTRHLEQFVELFDDAVTNSRIRDERDLYCNVPMAGVLRRGVIAAGKVAAEKGLIADYEHMTEASLSEIQQLLLKKRSDLSEELADRYAYRQRYSIDDIPAVIGSSGEHMIPVDPDWLPPHAALITKAMQVNQTLNTTVPDEESEPTPELLKGRAVSPGSYTGIARVIREANELNLIEQGEVLITRSTNPAFNIVLPRLGALVTEYGGVLSHAAIVSREFGLPGIVGCKKVTQRVTTGMRVTVNGDTGELTLHES